MNYPVWQLGFPGGLLIAAVAVLHVFVSHFAIGGGAYLVLTERRAYRHNDAALLGYVRRHSVFFALLTVVFGAVTGVGIWFTIGLIAPEATSSLIHTFVWGWAIEWVFFFVEIAAALIYAYQWDRLDRRTHMIVGWIYFGAAWASLAVINGIITYMLTPGRWLQTKSFADGFFNPTYVPSLLIRCAMAVALAGMFGLVTALWEGSPSRERIVRWAGAWLLIGMALLPPLAWWYYGQFPPVAHEYVAGMVAAARDAAIVGVIGTGLVLLLALIFALWKPRLMNPGVVLALLVCGVAVMGAGEYLREFARKPYTITGYIYANDLRLSDVARINAAGVRQFSPWVAIAGSDPLRYGHELFAMQCAACHSLNGYRPIRQFIRGWDATFASGMLPHLQLTRGAMPPFAGDAQDRVALGRYLASIAPPLPSVAPGALGRQVFETRCAMCHTVRGSRRGLDFAGMSADDLDPILLSLSDLSPNMPPFSGSEAERRALAVFLTSAK